MEFLLVIHLLICAAMIAVVLMQKSEGGALGIGGGGGAGGFLTGRGTANLLTRTTALLAAGFFLTSITMSVLSTRPSTPGTPFNAPASGTPGADQTGKPAPAGGTKAPGGNLLDKLKSGQGGQRLPSVPQGN